MDSPLSPVIADMVLQELEKSTLNNFSINIPLLQIHRRHPFSRTEATNRLYT